MYGSASRKHKILVGMRKAAYSSGTCRPSPSECQTGVHADARFHGATAHVAPHEKHGDAGGRDGRCKVHQDESLALVGDGGRDCDDAD